MLNKKFISILLSGLMITSSLVFSTTIANAAGINGWNKSGTTWKYYKDDKMKTGWLKDGASWYYLNADGNMAKGWVKDGGKSYLLNESGAMQTGWIQAETSWYYLNASGDMAINTTTPDGYTVDINGVRVVVSAKVAQITTVDSRLNPSKLGDLININSDLNGKITKSQVIVKDIIRGDEAYNLIKNNNTSASVPQNGYEYLLAKISFKLVKASDVHTQFSLSGLNFKMVSSNGKDYDDISVVVPRPSLDATLYEGSSNEGYVAFMVEKNDSKPLITYGRNSDSTGGVWFNAYTDNTSQNTTTTTKINRIKITSNDLNITTYGTTQIGKVNYIVNDQYGNDITTSYLANTNLVFQSGVGNITGSNGLITIIVPSTNFGAYPTMMITITDPKTGVTTTATLPITSNNATNNNAANNLIKQQYENDLASLLQQIQNTKNEKNIQTSQRQSDGTYQYVYVFDQIKVDFLQKSYDLKMLNYRTWLNSIQ